MELTHEFKIRLKMFLTYNYSCWFFLTYNFYNLKLQRWELVRCQTPHRELRNKEESMTTNSELYLCSLFANAPIWMSLITWAQDITQQNVTPPNSAQQKIAKAGKRHVTVWAFYAKEYHTFIWQWYWLDKKQYSPFFHEIFLRVMNFIPVCRGWRYTATDVGEKGRQ